MALPKINVPKYNTKVPSTGEEIQFRPYLVKEEKILMIALESENGTQINNAVKDIISACTFEKVDSNALTLFDVEYLFTKLRSKSVGETSTVLLPCSKCEEKNEVVLDLEKINLGDQPDNRIDLGSGTGLIMKYPSMTEYLDVAENKDLDMIDKIFAVIAKCIDQIYSGDDVFDAADQTQQELIDFVGELSSDQFKKVQAYLDAMPSVTVDAKFKCKECGHDNEVELKGLANFFS